MPCQTATRPAHADHAHRPGLPNCDTQPPGMAGLCARRLRVARPHDVVLDDICLTLRAGEILAVLGANGAGKSTLLSTLAGELPSIRTPYAAEDGHPDRSGVNTNSLTKPFQRTHDDSIPPCPGNKTTAAITLNGQDLDTLSLLQQARLRAVLPQKSGLAFDLDVNQVVAMGAYPYPDAGEHQILQWKEQALQHARILDLAHRRYQELSGGEQQRVHYARTILQILCGVHQDSDHRYIMLDEPTSSLNPLHQLSLLESVRQLAGQHAIGVLIILHDVNLAALFSDRIAMLCEGRLLACDSPAAVLTAENLYRVYGVHAQVMPHPRHPERPLVVFG